MLTAGEFIERWSKSAGSERSNAQPFFLDLCDLLQVQRPPTGGDELDDYRFEKPIRIPHPDGHESLDRIDFYKKGCFVIEAKQASAADAGGPGAPRRGTPAWQAMMERAFAQAHNYAVNLPGSRPPFLATCDIGHCFEVWTGFNGDYGRYGARRTIPLADLAREDVRQELAAIFTDPWSLDPARHAAKVTQEVAAYLADLARSLEADGTNPEFVAQFLMRCLFTMFAEDVGLLEKHLFSRTLEEVWIPEPHRFPAGIEMLWKEMNRGGMWGPHPIRRFNGGLFRDVHSMPLTADQLKQLLQAAKRDWSNVEPAIFGTMLERALDENERHKLGAHFTPREYIERLVRPTVIEPLRAEWDAVRGAARQLMEPEEGEPGAKEQRQAAKLLRDFLQRLCGIRVLDPACGTGNFLYVTFDLIKEMEGEVLRELADLGDAQLAMEIAGVRVTPEQFLGIEINPRAQAIADLVLWLGYLQWARRAKVTFSDPVLRDGKNIVCRDAVLAHDEPRLRLDEQGRPQSVWDMRTYKVHSVTGKEVPDEDARAPLYDYPNAHPAEWPEADFIVSNPPFVGNKRMREALGDGYTEALRKAWPDVDGSADLVMYWWEKAAQLARDGKIRRFGFITTNSITQAFNRKVLERHLKAGKNPLVIAWAIPDHPWVIDGAAVRIAMSVGCRADELKDKPTLGQVTSEIDPAAAPAGAARLVDVSYQAVARIHADLSGGADVVGVVPLLANDGLSCPGMQPHGSGLLVPQEVAASLGLGTIPGLDRHIREYRNGRDLADTPRHIFAIDLLGLTEVEVRERFPGVYQWVAEHVKPERDQNKRATYARNWWLFGEPRRVFRQSLSGLKRFIATPETSKWRWFLFLDTALLTDNMVVNIASDDAWVLGVLSSRIHLTWSLASGSRIGIGNDPRYNKTRCFDPFPFPDATESQRDRIRKLAEQLDTHRNSVQMQHPDVTLTGMYNALLRAREATAGGAPLTLKERAFHDKALIGLLMSIHDDLDAAVADAYGWPADLPDDEVLTRLVNLNAARAAEEAQGIIRWLRPDFQRARAGIGPAVQPELAGTEHAPKAGKKLAAPPWPKDRYDQIRAVRDIVAARPGTYTADEIAASFKSAPLAAVRRHLDMLERIGVLVGYDAPHGRRWHSGAV